MAFNLETDRSSCAFTGSFKVVPSNRIILVARLDSKKYMVIYDDLDPFKIFVSSLVHCCRLEALAGAAHAFDLPYLSGHPSEN